MAAVGAVLLGISLALAPAASASVNREALCPDTLQFGNSGGCVSELQTRLNELGAGLSVDGSFGWGTYYAVTAFQGRASIDLDGVVGPNTQNYLNNPGPVNLFQANPSDVLNYIYAVFGADGATAERIARCESGLNETAMNYNNNGTHDLGIFQMNQVHAGGDLITFDRQMLYYQSNSFSPWVCA